MLKLTSMRTQHHPKVETDDPAVLAFCGKKDTGKVQVFTVPWDKAKAIEKRFVKS